MGRNGCREPSRAKAARKALIRTRWADKSIEDACVVFSVKDNKIRDASMAVISPVAVFSSGYQDLHFVPDSK